MIPEDARVWIAMGHTDMRRGMQGLAAMVQQHFTQDPFAGDLWVFRGRSGSLVKIIWHDGIAMSLYTRRLEKGRFIWPSAKDGVVSLTRSQLACLLDGIDWRNPQYSCAFRTMLQNARCAACRSVFHYALHIQVSVNIGSISASTTRHGRPFRATADFTASNIRSAERI